MCRIKGRKGLSAETERTVAGSKGKILRLIKAFYIFVCTGLFAYYFRETLKLAGTVGVAEHPKANILIMAVYVFVLIWLVRVYSGLYFGVKGAAELAFSLSLSTIITNFIMHIIASIYINRIADLRYILILDAINIAVNIVFAWFGNHIYYIYNKPKKTAVVYRELTDLRKLHELEQQANNFRIVKCIEYAELERKGFTLLDGMEAVFLVAIDESERNDIVKYCVKNNIISYVEPKIGDILMSGGKRINCFSVPIIRVMEPDPTFEYLIIKRISDVLLAASALVLLSPVLLLTSLAIKLYDGGPVFYRQVRLTKDSKKFKIVKFRSMRVDAEKDGIARLATENDDRITPVGRFIRSCRIDELPQLINVIKGDMSIVGPRPERPEIAEQYEEILPDFNMRLSVKAGITGFAQVYGKYNSEPYDKLQMDLMYINRMSVAHDLWLILATVKVLFQKESTSGVENGQLTAAKLSNDAAGDEVSVSASDSDKGIE